MKGEVILDPDDGSIDCRTWVKDRTEDVQNMTDFFASTVNDGMEPEKGGKVLYVSW
jgi:hypothetical protein